MSLSRRAFIISRSRSVAIRLPLWTVCDIQTVRIYYLLSSRRIIAVCSNAVRLVSVSRNVASRNPRTRNGDGAFESLVDRFERSASDLCLRLRSIFQIDTATLNQPINSLVTPSFPVQRLCDDYASLSSDERYLEISNDSTGRDLAE